MELKGDVTLEDKFAVLILTKELRKREQRKKLEQEEKEEEENGINIRLQSERARA
jgi:hypothetical protein